MITRTRPRTTIDIFDPHLFSLRAFERAIKKLSIDQLRDVEHVMADIAVTAGRCNDQDLVLACDDRHVATCDELTRRLERGRR